LVNNPSFSSSLPSPLAPLSMGEGNNEKYYTGSGTKFNSYSPYKDTSPDPNQFKIRDAIDF